MILLRKLFRLSFSPPCPESDENRRPSISPESALGFRSPECNIEGRVPRKRKGFAGQNHDVIRFRKQLNWGATGRIVCCTTPTLGLSQSFGGTVSGNGTMAAIVPLSYFLADKHRDRLPGGAS
jgi:hypothetical protein